MGHHITRSGRKERERRRSNSHTPPAMTRKKSPPLFAPTRRLSSCLVALLTYGVAQAGEGALDQSPSHPPSSKLQQQQHQQQRQHAEQQLRLTPAVSTTAKLLDRITGGGANNHRRRKHSSRHQAAAGGGGGGASAAPDAIEVSGADLGESTNGRLSQQQHLDGIYVREWDVNGAPHFKRRSKVGVGKGRGVLLCSLCCNRLLLFLIRLEKYCTSLATALGPRWVLL